MATIIHYAPDLASDKVDLLRPFEEDIGTLTGGGTFYWEAVETIDVVSFYGAEESLLELHQQISENEHVLRCFIRGSELGSFTAEQLADQLRITGKPPAS